MGLKRLFNEIVDAIHEKDGQTDGIAAKDFPRRIRSLATIEADTDWHISRMPIASAWYSTLYHNGMYFIGSSTGHLYYSQNGIVWLETRLPDKIGNILFLTHFNGKYIAIGPKTTAHSDDLKTWELSPSFIYGANSFNKFASNGNVIIGSDMARHMVRSTNGINWTSTTISNSYVSGGSTGIIYGNGIWARLSDANNINVYSDDDGVSWKIQQQNVAFAPYVAAFGNNVFLSINSTGKYVTRSDDGITWELVSDVQHPFKRPRQMKFIDGRFVVISEQGGAYESRDNGETWSPVGTLWDDSWSVLEYGDGTLITAANGSYVGAYIKWRRDNP